MQAIANFSIAFMASLLWFVAVRRIFCTPSILVFPGAIAVWAAVILFGGWLHADMLSSLAAGSAPDYRPYQGPLVLCMAVAYQWAVEALRQAFKRAFAGQRNLGKASN